MTAYTDFLSDPLHQSIYLAEVHYGDPSDSSSGVLYYSTGTYGTEASDTPASQLFDARIAESYNFSSTAGSGEEGIGTITGLLPALEGGTLNLVQKLGDLDSLRDYTFDGRQVILRHGGSSPRYGKLDYADFKEVFNGEVNGQPVIGIDQVTFQLAARQSRFEHPINIRTYRGGSWCLLFDGTNDDVACGTSSSFDFTTSDFTVEFWIYLESVPGTGRRVISRGSALADGWDVRVSNSGAEIIFSTYQAGATQETTSTGLTLTKWNHVAVVRAGAAATIYLNGNDATATPGTHTNPLTSARTLYFGRNDAGTVYFPGFLDEVRISNTARGQRQIAARMGRLLSTTEAAGYLGYWKMEEGTGTTLTNAGSATSSNGTITGATWRTSLQGGDELEGSLLPEVWGARYGVPPTLCDATTRIYQVHSGPINSIVGVYEGGNAITLDSTPGIAYTDLTTFLAATTAAGFYEVLTTTYGSYIRLGSNPTLPITIDIQGDKSGGTYRSKASDIWRYIVATRGPQPLADPAEIDDTAFDTAAADVTAIVGIDYSDEISIAEVGNFLLSGVGLTSWFERDGGLLTVKRFAGVAAETAILDLTEQDVEIGTLEPLNAGSPIWCVDVSWRKNSLVHSTGDIAAAVIGGSRWNFLLREWRLARATDHTIRTTYKGAQKISIYSAMAEGADAGVEANRRLDLFVTQPQAFRGFFRERATQLDRFDAVTFHFRDIDRYGVQQSRFGTSATAKFIVLAAEDDTAKGGTWLTLYREAVA